MKLLKNSALLLGFITSVACSSAQPDTETSKISDVASLQFGTDIQNIVSDSFQLVSDTKESSSWTTSGVVIDGHEFSFQVDADKDLTFKSYMDFSEPDLVKTYFMPKAGEVEESSTHSDHDAGVAVGVMGATQQSFSMSGIIVSSQHLPTFKAFPYVFSTSAVVEIRGIKANKNSPSTLPRLSLSIECESKSSVPLLSKSQEISAEYLKPGTLNSLTIDLVKYDFDFSACENQGGLRLKVEISKSGYVGEVNFRKLVWSANPVKK